jgi:N-acetylglutamate synthase-like GNAT family acetyltransferase
LASADDLNRILEIVGGLPDYFTSDVPGKIRSDFPLCWSLVIVEDGVVAGFVVVDRRWSEVAEFLWAAVDAGRRDAGLGTRLVDDVLATLLDDGVHLVEVKTLDSSSGYQPYEATRAFWEGRGFLKIDVIDPFPGWQPGNPCALYVRALLS